MPYRICINPKCETPIFHFSNNLEGTLIGNLPKIDMSIKQISARSLLIKNVSDPKDIGKDKAEEFNEQVWQDKIEELRKLLKNEEDYDDYVVVFCESNHKNIVPVPIKKPPKNK